ncbi:MAG: transporter [Geobacter sp.]|nr:MAG: transporter [Geobacter sp.]
MKKSLHLSVLLFAVSMTLPCYAGNPPGQSQVDDASQLKKIVEQQGQQLKEQQLQIEKLQRQFGADDRSLDIRGGADTGQFPNQDAPVETRSNEKDAGGKQAAQSQDQLPSQPVGRPPEKPVVSKQYKEIEAIFARQGVLTPKGTIVLEPSFQYAFSSSNRVVLSGFTIVPAITIGLIDVQSVNRNTYIPALTLRYGLTNRLEMQVYVPFVYRDDSSVETAQNVPDATQQVFNARGHNLGDVQFGLRYQFNMPTGSGPIFIGGLLAKTPTGKDPFHVPIDSLGNEEELPTGTGFWGIQPSLSVIFPTDPVVFFGSVNYLYNFQADQPINGVKTDIEPGGTFGLNFGIGFSLNEKTSFSVGYEHYLVMPTEIHNTSVIIAPTATQTTTLGSLVFGTSYRLSNRVNINFSLEAGITQDAPDIQLTLRVPISI